MKHYKQCTLKNGETCQVAWIPSEFAKVGKTIRIKDDDGWKVTTVGNTLPQEAVESNANEYRYHRNVTDT